MSAVGDLIAEVLRRFGSYVQSGKLHEARSYSMSADSVGRLVEIAIAAQQERVEGHGADAVVSLDRIAAGDVFYGTPGDPDAKHPALHVTDVVIPAAATGLGRAVRVHAVSEGPEYVSAPDEAGNRPSVDPQIKTLTGGYVSTRHPNWSMKECTAWNGSPKPVMFTYAEYQADQERREAILNHGTCE